MKPILPNTRQRIRRWGGSVFFIVVVVGWLTLAPLGCTSDRRYQVMSFFFDGVPNPNAPVPVDPEKGTVVQHSDGVRVVVYAHKPFVDNQCDSCHASASGRYQDFDKVDPDVCLKCHNEVVDQYAFMHGPVATVECNYCHNPHESTIPGMLREKSPKVCTQCHDRELLGPEPPEHLVANVDCLGCHVAHGSDRRGLLRNAVAHGPTTAPAIGPEPAESPGGVP